MAKIGLSFVNSLFGEYYRKNKIRSRKHFYKNLANVQGNERDLIFIKPIYGKNHDNKVLQVLVF